MTVLLLDAVSSKPFLLGFTVAAVLSLLAARRWRHRGAAASTGILLCLALAEAVLPAQAPVRAGCEHLPSPTNPGIVSDPDLGYRPRSGTVLDALPMDAPYTGTYGIDENGLRRRYPGIADESILLFGGSFTFGEGVADDETSAYLLGEALAGKAEVYNFGYGGYGPHQMLSMLRSGRVEEIVHGEPKWVFFQLIDHHVRRVVGNTPWSIHDPRYVLTEDGGVRYSGLQCDPRSESSFLVKVLGTSAIYREVASHTFPHDVDTLLGVVRTARREVEARFPGCRFVVVHWDRETWKSRRMRSGLDEAGIPVIRVRDVLPGYAKDPSLYHLSPDNHHPTAEAHALIARCLAEVVFGRREVEAP